MTIGWGIIGIGKHVNRFMGPAIRDAADTKFVAVCSRSMERAKNFASAFGAARAYDSLAEMLKDPELDVLYVATPNHLHPENTIQAAKAGKHVLCEKPMALTEAECEKMIEACDKYKVKLGMDFQNRYHPAHIVVRRLIRDGEVGEIKVARVQYCHGRGAGLWQGWRADLSLSGGAAINGSGPHPLDLLRFILGQEVVEIRAQCIPPEGIDEQNFVLLTFENGAVATSLSGNLVPRSDNDGVFYGTKAKVTCKGTVGMLHHGELFVEGDNLNVHMTFPVDDPVTGCYRKLVEAFNKTIAENREPDIPGQNGLQMVRIVHAVLESSRLGKAVRLKK
jgi:1,5-anhydro-D-fructose reductase (1,5-anhydro-D-mannitol-forming)